MTDLTVLAVPAYFGSMAAEHQALEEQLGAYRAEGFDIAGMFPVTVHRQTFRILEFDAVLVRQEAFSASRA